MPFLKGNLLRLKKSRQYNVVSKSLFVICIELLDSSSTECTLTSESTGRECLENVCQRLGLQQTEFLGLRYISKTNCPRWIELERPLKRQLDKYAKDNGLYLRVMYYVSGIDLIRDEMTRYHYFLQLKNDVIEGRIQCNVDEAVLLASFCMQAEFGNYNSERHTPEYLKDFALFPKDLIENGLLERLTNAVIHQHSGLMGLSQGTAEEEYISAVQQLEGYGQETFLVKDEHGLETILAVTLKGIITNSEQSGKFYKWSEIINVINHKKNFGIECQQNEQIVNFTFPDVESAKYVWRMCVHQHTFYMSYEQNDDDDIGGVVGEKNDSTRRGGGRHLFQNIDAGFLSSREELDEPMNAHTSMRNVFHDVNVNGSREELVERQNDRNSNLDLVDKSQDLEKLRSLLPSYRPAPDYETAIQQKYKSDQMYSSQPEIHTFPDVTQHYGHRNVLHTYSTPDLEKQMFMVHILKSPPPYPISNSTPDLASQSTPDLANQNIHINNAHIINTQVSGSSPDLVSSRSLRQQYNVHHYPETHRTYANLANIMSQQQQNQQLFEDKNMMYHYLNNNNSEANNMLIQYLNNKSNIETQRHIESNRITNNRLNANSVKTHEPIYENVPLPWQSSNKMISNEQNNEKSLAGNAAQRQVNIKTQSNNDNKIDIHRTNSVESRKSSTNSNKLVADFEIMNLNKELRLSDRSSRKNSVQFDQISTKIETRNDNVHVPLMKQLESENCLIVNTSANIVRNIGNETNLNVQNEIGIRNTGNEVSNIQMRNTGNKVINVPSIISENIDSDPLNNINVSKLSDSKLLSVSNRNSKEIKHNTSSSTTNSSLFAQENSNISHISTDSTSSNNTVDKRKKKWGGFLSSSGNSSSKSKSGTLPKTEGKTSTTISQPISKEAMCQILEKKLSDQQLFFEFEKIPKVPKTNVDFSSGTNVDNISRNRYKDILPYEENRVRLTPKRDNKLGYINASHITATVGKEQRFYIAAQSPLPNTVNDFWEMIWETNVYLVVNVCDKTKEDSNVKYIPDKLSKNIDVGEFRVSRELSQETGHCVTCKLKLTHLNSKRHRSVWYLKYTNWNMTSNVLCPISVSHFLGFLEEMNCIREHIVTEIPCGHNKNPPILIYCLDGVEKTGLVILCDILLYLTCHNEQVDIARILLSLRNQRMKFVPNIAQYTFMYSLLTSYLKQSRLI